MNKKTKFIIVALLIAFSFIAFGKILGNDFINLDDPVCITNNQHIQAGLDSETIKWAFTDIVLSNWLPLTLVSHALDWSLFGNDPGKHHFINLLLHIGAALFLFFFLNKTTGEIWLSALAAALFALHPLRVESVAWAAERKDVLSMFLGMACIYTYSAYAESTSKNKLFKYFLCLILFALGLMAKPMLVTLPFVLLLLDYWPLERWRGVMQVEKTVRHDEATIKKKKKRQKSEKQKKITSSSYIENHSGNIGWLLSEKIPFFILTIASCIITIWAQNKGGAIESLQKLPFVERLSNAVISYVSYLGQILWPVNLAIFYPYQHFFPYGQMIPAVLFLAGVSIIAIYTLKKAPFLFVGWYWYLGTLIPVIGLVQVGRQAIADRYSYFPSIGITILLIWGIASLFSGEKKRRIILFPAVVCVLIVLTFLTWKQCGYWKNSIELFNHALQVTQNNYLAHDNLGVALAKEGNIDQAISHYRSALQINPNDDNTNYNLGNAFQKQNKIDDAIFYYGEAVKLNPNNSKAQNNLGVFLDARGQYDEAISHYLQAVKVEPDNPGFHFNLGMSLGRKGALAGAIEHFQRAVYLNPDYKEARQMLKLAIEIQQRKKNKSS